jgi:hypothetical protein
MVERPLLAAIDTATGQPTSWKPNPTGLLAHVNALAISGSTLYVGGTFSEISGQQNMGMLAAFDTSTDALVTSWKPKVTGFYNYSLGAQWGQISALAVSGSTLFVSGDFATVNDVPCCNHQFLAAISTISGQPLSTWPAAPPDDKVVTLAVSNGTVYVGGYFKNIAGQAHNYLAALSQTSGALFPNWAPNPDNYVLSIALSNITLYVGGQFSKIGGQSHARLASLAASTGVVSSWAPNPNGDIQSLAVFGTTLYVAGDFSTIGGQHRTNLAAFTASSGVVSSWAPNPDGAVHALASSSSTVYIGGAFNTMNGEHRPNLAFVAHP